MIFPVKEMNDKNSNIEVITLELDNYKSYNNLIKNQKPFVLYYSYSSSYVSSDYLLLLYDENGQLKNKISHKDYIRDKCKIVQYKPNNYKNK